MPKIDITLEIPKHIADGLSNGMYERIGGVVREVQSKQIIGWLSEISSHNHIVSNISTLSSGGAIIGVLNLAISTMGFVIILKRLRDIEQHLEQAQKILQSIDYKINLSFYANFQAALDLALNGFTMTNTETRKTSAMHAINRFLEAEQHYLKLTDKEIGNGSQVADEYLSTLCLAYVTEARCYLELEELETARRRLHEGAALLRPRFEKHINTLLTSNPAAYLHPNLKGKVGLKRLTRIYQWLKPSLDESAVFEMQRENLFSLARSSEKWRNSLPQAIHISKSGLLAPNQVWDDLMDGLPAVLKIPGLILGVQETGVSSSEAKLYSHLPAMMELMEMMIEDYNRLMMYESEIAMIGRLGMNFQEWCQLKVSSTPQGKNANLMYISVL